MKVLELFAGSRSFSKVAEEMGMETFTTDYKAFDKIDLVIDIFDLENDLLMEKLFEKGIDKVDCIWASPPCTYFSVASIGFKVLGKSDSQTCAAVIPYTPLLTRAITNPDAIEDALSLVHESPLQIRRNRVFCKKRKAFRGKISSALRICA